MSKLTPFLLSVFFCLSSLHSEAQSNQYLHFDGSDDYTSTENGSQFVAEAEGVSMTGWFYTDALIYGQGMMSIRGGGSGDGEMYLIQLSDGILECRYISSDGFHQVVGPAGTIQAGVWQHLAWVFDGSTVELFIDGESAGSTAASGVIESVDRPFTIGKSVESGFNFVFGGRADEVTLWSRGLSEAEIEDMMANELNGDEPGLELYYKMNQGVPGADNSSITTLTCEIPGPRSADLLNFEMNGSTSNFDGILEDGFQSIVFADISNKLVSAEPFELEAASNSGLPISFSIVSGPASVSGNTVTLDGVEGTVVVQASQEGNDVFDPAVDVEVSFDVVDPATLLAEIDLRNPIQGDFYAAELMPIQLASIVDVPYPDLFQISDIVFSVDGEVVPHTDHGNLHQTAWWTPDAFGSHEFTVSATHSEGTTHSETVSFNITDQTIAQVVTGTDALWVNSDIFSAEAEAVLPSYVGTYQHIEGLLDITCPIGGCDPWDRVSTMEVKGHNGEWYEIIRYLTPYGVPCDHQIDLTDFMSLLQGKVRFRVNLGTQGNGFLYNLDLDYQAGTPEHPYSTVEKLWYDTYALGDMADLQPTEDLNITYPENTLASKLKVVSTGHGWGENNTANAAEFHQDTHHFWVNGEETFSQLNWNDCDPNPDGCDPQFGTWYFNRAGWCPGSIAQFFDYDMTPFVGSEVVDLDYVFDEDYTDFCHPNNPNCITGVTCSNCDDGFNPHLIVTSYLISLGDAPLMDATVGLEDVDVELNFGLFPNPSSGRFAVNLSQVQSDGEILVLNLKGQEVYSERFPAGAHRADIDLASIGAGVYLVQVRSEDGIAVKKLVVD